ncbi:hypothetical protein [Hydrogenophaga sp.]|jgi:hypothetical protein|uniref:hypothetical protein n=1 Tax=Hydrogenophaga sp. TaxID=1904254 RepID=UPI003F7210D3
MTNWLIGALGVSIAFVAGIVVGALLWRWRAGSESHRTGRQQNRSAPLLWDIHSVLNAMNKLALAAERGRPVEPSLVYLLSDYLLHSALIQREDGWADRNSLENWLLSHVRVLADHRGQITLPAATIQLGEGVQRIHANPLLRQLLWILQKAPTINRIQIDVLALKAEDRAVKVRIEVEGDHAELTRLLEDRSTVTGWRMDSGLCACELRTAYESGAAA